MKKKMTKILSGFLAVSIILGISGCGGSDNSSDTTNTEVITDTSTPITPAVQGSPYFNKIGENGAVLDAGATNWEMTELKEEGLLVYNPSLIQSLKTYTYSEAEEYCSNLSSGGYSDFRLPTSSELRLLLKVIIISQTERNYFKNYFEDIADSGTGYILYKSILSSTRATIRIRYKSSGYKVESSPNGGGTAFCVRKW